MVRPDYAADAGGLLDVAAESWGMTSWKIFNRAFLNFKWRA